MKRKRPPGRKCERCGKTTGATTWYGYERRLLHPRCAELERKDGKLLTGDPIVASIVKKMYTDEELS